MLFKLCFLNFLCSYPLAAPFNETCTLTSRKYVVEQGLNVLQPSEKHLIL